MMWFIDFKFLNALKTTFGLKGKTPDRSDVYFHTEKVEVAKKLFMIDVLMKDVEKIMIEWEAREKKYDAETAKYLKELEKEKKNVKSKR
jgi:hypothetical protein